MDLLGLIVGGVGVLLAVLVAVKGRQLSAPKLEISVGHPEPKHRLPRAARRYTTTAIVFGTASNKKPRVVAIPFILHNASSVAIADLSLRLEYPAQQLLKDSLVHTADGATRILVTEDPRSGRTVQTFFDKAYVEFDVGVVRPRDTLVVTDFLFLSMPDLIGPRMSPVSDERIVRATRRFRDIPGFEALTPIDIFARSSNGPAVAISLNVIWIVAGSLATLSSQGNALALAAWDGKKPRPGVYFHPLRPLSRRLWMRIRRKERFSFVYLEGDGEMAESAQQIGERTIGAEVAIGIYQVPQWGLTGEEFDIGKLLGRRIGGAEL